MSEVSRKVPAIRLKYVDLARSIAILLMLEGHFVGLALAPTCRDFDHPVYACWNLVRGFTAPLFFTVAGMIFVYLLSGEINGPYFQRKRVRKGIVRAGELIFWGYLLQLSLLQFPNYLKGDFDSWVFAFHVLQCIGLGLLALIGTSWLSHHVPRVPLVVFHLLAMVGCLGAYLWIKQFPDGHFLPMGWPSVLQNIIRGPHSIFPVAPWFSFIFLGGAIGSLLRAGKTTNVFGHAGSARWFFVMAILMKFIWFINGALTIFDDSTATGLSWFTNRATEVIVFLGILRWIETRFGIGVPWLLKVGTLTFPIYVVHVMVLYGGFFGFGLDDVIKGKLNPVESAMGAFVFLGCFVLLAQLVSLHKPQKRIE